MKKIKVSAVSYLNTIPFIYGIENNTELLSKIELSKDIPSQCARKLVEDEVDLGLVPVAVIPSLKTPEIISDYCIGAVGKVRSVLLLSDVPLQEIQTVILDYHSRTSIALCQVLCKRYWNINPSFEAANKGFEENISSKKAGVIIGDRTFHLSKDYRYQYDLAEEWQKMTSLPFVFAAWVSNKKIPKDFINLFNSAVASGIHNIEKAVDEDSSDILSREEKIDYLTNSISYDYNSEKKKALNSFLTMIQPEL